MCGMGIFLKVIFVCVCVSLCVCVFVHVHEYGGLTVQEIFTVPISYLKEQQMTYRNNIGIYAYRRILVTVNIFWTMGPPYMRR